MVVTTEVAGHVLQMLNIESAEIAEDANLLEFGLNSLALMQLVDLFRAKYCKTLEYTDFVMAPSVREWTEILNQALEMAQSSVVTLNSNAGENARAPMHDENADVPLAEMQYAYWSGRQADKVAAHLYVEFDGKSIDVVRLQKAVDEIFSRHAMLRAQVSDQGRQRIRRFQPGVGLSVDNYVHLSAQDVEQVLAHKRQRMTHQLLAIADGQVVDLSLTLLPGARHRFHIDVDMVAIDPHSFLILLEDLARAYMGTSPEFVSNDADFFNYLALQAQDSERKLEAEQHKEWWSKKLLAMPASPALPLTPHGFRSEVSSTSLSCYLEPGESRFLAAIAQEQNCSLTTVLLGVFSIILARWSAESHFRLNFPLFKRKPYVSNTDSIVGDFTTFVLLDIELENSQSLAEIFKAIEAEIANTSSHTSYSGVSLLRDLSKSSHANEIAPVVFTSGLDVGELFSSSVLKSLGRPVWCVSQGPKVDLDVQVALCNERVFINWDVRLDAFKGEVANDMFTTYIAALKQLAEKPLVAMRRGYELLPQSLLLPAASAPLKSSRVVTGLTAKIIESLQSVPEQNAITFENETVNYQQLAVHHHNILGNLLHSGVGRETKVLVVVDQFYSVAVIAALFAAGICFVPVSSHMVAGVSKEKLNGWLEQLGCDLVIAPDAFSVTKSHLTYTQLLSPTANKARLQELLTDMSGQPDPVAFLSIDANADSSISIERVLRSQLEREVDSILSATDLNKDHVCLSIINKSTGLPIAELISALIANASLILVDSRITATPLQWRDLIKARAVTHLFATTAQVSTLIRHARLGELDKLTHCLMSGEEISLGMAQHFIKLKCPAQLLLQVNWGGVATPAIVRGAIATQACGKIPYLAYRQVSGSRYQVMDKYGQVCPDWVAGELYVANEDEQSAIAQYATTDAFLPGGAQENSWLRTGKIASRINSSDIILSAKNIILADRQGYRISLTELSNIIATIDGVYESVLIPRARNSEAEFALAIVPDDALIDVKHIQRELSLRLPSHFIPEPVFLLDAMPLDQHGRIDSNAMQDQLLQSLQNYQALESSALQQASALERTVTYICAQIIGMPSNELDAADDFFEQGGDSLLATHLTAHLNQYFQGANLTVVDVFSLRSPGSLAELIDDNLPSTANKIAEVFLTVIEGE